MENEQIKKDIGKSAVSMMNQDEKELREKFEKLLKSSEKFINGIEKISEEMKLYNSNISKRDTTYDKVVELYKARNDLEQDKSSDLEKALGPLLFNYQKSVDNFFGRKTILTIVNKKGNIIFVDEETEKTIMSNLERDYRKTTGSATMRAFNAESSKASALNKKLQKRISESEKKKADVFNAARKRYNSNKSMYYFYRHLKDKNGNNIKRRVYHYKNDSAKTKMHDIAEYYTLAVLTDDKDINKNASLLDGAKSKQPYFEKYSSRQKDTETSYENALENLYYKYIYNTVHNSIPALVKADIKGSELTVKDILKGIQDYEFQVKYGYTARVEKIGQFINMAYFIIKLKEKGTNAISSIKEEMLNKIAKDPEFSANIEDIINDFIDNTMQGI